MEDNKSFLYKSSNHAVNLNRTRLSNMWCDVTIKVNEKEFHAHKAILAANLTYFETMLSHDSFRECKQDVISMEGIDETDLEVFISYAYTGEILLTDSNALDLLELANYLGENEIRDACAEFLKKHLRKEDACRAFKFAVATDCFSLKNIAKTIILSNFVDCSRSTDYLDFRFEHLMAILSKCKVQSKHSQKKYFEGIVKWIMHDVKQRKACLDDLLQSIDVTKLTADDVLRYLFENGVDYNDGHGILKDAMVFYHASKCQLTKQLLMVVDIRSKIFKYQVYDFNEKKWSPLEELQYISGLGYGESMAILNHELYYKSEHDQKQFTMNVLKLTTKQSSTVNSSDRIFRYNAMCTCSEFVYLCGGILDGCSITNYVLKYEPREKVFVRLAPMHINRMSAAAIFYQNCLHVLGGCNFKYSLKLVEKYDADKKQWTDLPSMCERRSHFAVAVLDDKLYACGGSDEEIINSVEVYDPTQGSWRLVARMIKPRWRFLVIAHKGKLFAIGGDEESTAEVYDPDVDKWQIDTELSSGLQIQHLQGGFISSK